MKKVIEQKREYLQWMPFLCYGIIMIAFHLSLNEFGRDDLQYINLHLNESFSEWLEFLVTRYSEWSSRLVIDGAMVLLVHYTWLWKILDSILMVGIACVISFFFNPEKNQGQNWLIVLAMLTFPMRILNTAGWISTTLNYTWPFAFGLLGLLPMKRLLDKEHNRWYIYLFGVLGTIFAVSQEQMCAVMLALGIVFTVYLWSRDKQICWYGMTEIGISLFFLGVILLCPGNVIRKAEETLHWFPAYDDLSLFRKLEMGYSSSLFELIMEPNLVFTIFVVVLLVAVWSTNKNRMVRGVVTVPFGIAMIFGLFGEIFELVLPNLLDLRNAMTQIGTGIILGNPRTWLPDILITAVVVCVFIGLWFAFEKIYIRLFAIIVLCLGFATRWVMCFSPTIWASNDRTYTFLYMALIIDAVLLGKQYITSGEKNSNSKKIMCGVVAAFILFILDNYLSLL